MGKFDGYLICSDLDGTFIGGGDTIEVNSKAVKYFTYNGGKFTFVTGRTATYLPEQEFFGFINAPAGIFNGGLVYDYQNKKTLKESRLEFELGDFENDVKLIEYADIGVATGNAVDCVKQAADLIVKDNKNYALKDLIEIIESRI